MTRFAGLALIVWVVVLAASVGGSARELGQADGVGSGGIGLSREDWEELHGPGEAAQNYVAYEGGTYYVQFQGDIVSFLEFGWDDPGVALAEAEAAVRELLPTDARLAESFAAPATAGGPISLLMHRYDSPALVDALLASGNRPTGGILVIYQETPAPDRFEPNVARVSIAVGAAP
jgi:hypothetical protein